MSLKVLRLLCTAAGLTLASGCNGPLASISDHMDRVINIYDEHLVNPGLGLRELVTYLQTNNAAVEAAVDELRMRLSKVKNTAHQIQLAKEIQRTLHSRRVRLFNARVAWQKVAIIDPSTSEQIRNLGSILVEDAQTTFDAALSALFRDVKRLTSP